MREDLDGLEMIRQFRVDIHECDLMNLLALLDDGTLLRRQRTTGVYTDFVEGFRVFHQIREERKGVVFDKVRVEHLHHDGIGHSITNGLTVDGVLMHDVKQRRKELVHSLPVASHVGIELDPNEQDVQDEGLGALQVVERLIWQALDILQYLVADELVLPRRGPR